MSIQVVSFTGVAYSRARRHYPGRGRLPACRRGWSPYRIPFPARCCRRATIPLPPVPSSCHQRMLASFSSMVKKSAALKMSSVFRARPGACTGNHIVNAAAGYPTRIRIIHCTLSGMPRAVSICRSGARLAAILDACHCFLRLRGENDRRIPKRMHGVKHADPP